MAASVSIQKTVTDTLAIGLLNKIYDVTSTVTGTDDIPADPTTTELNITINSALNYVTNSFSLKQTISGDVVSLTGATITYTKTADTNLIHVIIPNDATSWIAGTDYTMTFKSA